MPNPATPANQNPTVTYTEDQLKRLQKNVAENLNQAGVKVPYEAVRPVHVPEAHPRTINDLNEIDAEKSVPASFNSTPETALSPLKAISEHLDYADQIVTGRSHVTDEAGRFTAFKNEKENKKQEYASSDKTISKSPVKKFVDWLHE